MRRGSFFDKITILRYTCGSSYAEPQGGGGMSYLYRLPYIVGKQSWYPGDTGDDMAMPFHSPELAMDDGMVIYAEGLPGQGCPHTSWVACRAHPHDTPGCTLIHLAHPFVASIGLIQYQWMCHQCMYARLVRDGIDRPYPVKRGVMVGWSGIGRDVPHLHLGLLTDRSQAPGTFMPPAEIAEFLRTRCSSK